MARLTSRAGFVVALCVGVIVSATPAVGDGSYELWQHQVTARSFDRTTIPDRPSIDNRLLPWPVGTQLTFDGTVVDDGISSAHQVVIVVTDLVKVVDGVVTRVILDNDVSEGVIKESELAFQAQDRRNGTVWSLGEYPEEFEDGEFAGAPNTWLSGVARARTGILMQGYPKAGGYAFSQGRAPSIDFADEARVIGPGPRVCVPAGCFDDVVVIDEWDVLDPTGGHQIKYHAPGVGVVLIEASGGDSQETLSLVSVRQLGPAELADARAEALRLDRRAYRTAPEIYGGTPRAYRLT